MDQPSITIPSGWDDVQNKQQSSDSSKSTPTQKDSGSQSNMAYPQTDTAFDGGDKPTAMSDVEV